MRTQFLVSKHIHLRCMTLQYIATHCNTLQRTVTNIHTESTSGVQPHTHTHTHTRTHCDACTHVHNDAGCIDGMLKVQRSCSRCSAKFLDCLFVWWIRARENKCVLVRSKRRKECEGVYCADNRERERKRESVYVRSCNRCNAKSLDCYAFDAFEKGEEGVCICVHVCERESNPTYINMQTYKNFICTCTR